MYHSDTPCNTRTYITWTLRKLDKNTFLVLGREIFFRTERTENKKKDGIGE